MFSDYMVPFGEHIFQKGDGKFVIKKAFLFLKANEEMMSLPVNKILSKWESVMDWTIGVKEQLA